MGGGPLDERNFSAVLDKYDREIGRFLDEIRAMGLNGSTLVLFSSDNGPQPSFRHERSGGLRGMSMYFGSGRTGIATLELKKQHAPDGRLVVEAVYDKTMRADDEPNPLVVHSISKAVFQFDKTPASARAWNLKQAFRAQDGSVMGDTAVEKNVSVGRRLRRR